MFITLYLFILKLKHLFYRKICTTDSSIRIVVKLKNDFCWNMVLFIIHYPCCDLWLKVHKILSSRCLHWADGVNRAILQAVEAVGWSSNGTV